MCVILVDMPIQERRFDRGTERGRRLTYDVGREIREARRDRGLSTVAVARALTLAPSTISRIERGLHSEVSVLALARLAAAVGLDLTMKLFPGGPPLRDVAHVRLLLAFREQLHPSIRWATEVPVRSGDRLDRRAWDAIVTGRGWMFGLEAETAPRNAQALVRRMNLKLRDSAMDGLILLVPATRAARAFLAEAQPLLTPDLPIDGKLILASLRAGSRPPGSGIVMVARPERSGRAGPHPAATAIAGNDRL